MARAIMVLGTGSDVGKSITATALCRILKRKGYSVAPFKAQNMSNNSFVTVEGGEIGRAQAVQAEAAGVPPSVHMNPILLKPSSVRGSQVVLQGRVMAQMEAMDYYRIKSRLKEAVMESYKKLAREYDVIVMEGAGSCCEMNLKENDLVNFSMARAAKAACILVADIDRGGVFAQIIGSYHLMTQEERGIVLGFIINKFRGDQRLFDTGITYIEDATDRPVLGLVPYYSDISIDPEDSVSVQENRCTYRPVGPNTVNIGVLRLPAISNFTDIEALGGEPDVVVNYLFRPGDWSDLYDLLIIPGTKNVIEDACWLDKTGWREVIRGLARTGGRILGICGGYQLMGKRIIDPHGVESDRGEQEGLDILPVETVLCREKVVRKVKGRYIEGDIEITGYEIHMGKTHILGDIGRPFLEIQGLDRQGNSWPDGCIIGDARISGTYVHGILDSPGFRGNLLNSIRRQKGLEEMPPVLRSNPYDRLADLFEAHCDIDRIVQAL